MHYMVGLLILEVSLCLVSLAGDHLLLHCQAGLVKAVSDSATHACVGLLSWLLTIYQTSILSTIRANWTELVVATFLAAVIDVDHFIEAGSFSLKAAVSLPRRPFLHCTSIPVLVLIAATLVATFLKNNLIFRFGLLIFSCIFSHHLRDASRRGLWFYGLPTVAVPYTLYLGLELLLPLLYRTILKLNSLTLHKSDNILIV